MKKELFIYPWDVMDEGADVLASRLEAWGVESVSLALLYHSGRLLLPHDPTRRVLQHGSSRSYFPFDSKRYGRLHPRKAELLQGDAAEFVGRIVKVFSGYHIRVCAWVVLFHGRRLAADAPELAIENIWGEPSAYSICPSQEEVFDYGLNVLEEVAASGVEEMHLESVDYAGFLHGAHHEMQAYADADTLNSLAGLCFCPACVRNAEREGIDAKKLQSQLKKRAQAFLDLKTMPQVDQELLKQYYSMRCGRISEFYRKLRGRIGEKVKVKPILWMTDGADPRSSGVDPSQLISQTDGMLCLYPRNPEDVPNFVRRIRGMLPEQVPVTAGIRLMAPNTLHPHQVEEYLEQYRKQGIEDVIFYNYGMAPEPFLEAMGKV